MIPYRPMHLAVSICDNQAKLFFTVQLLVKQFLMPMDSLDELTTLGLKWASFDPLPNAIQSFCFFLAPVGFKNGQKLPYL
jgi:hypothetical protein